MNWDEEPVTSIWPYLYMVATSIAGFATGALVAILGR